MLTIRRSQMQAMAAARRLDFERRLIASLPAGALASQADVRACIDEALRFVRTEAEVARLVPLLLQHRARWADGRLPDAGHAMLSNRALPGARRIDNFERWARSARRHGGH